MGTTQYTIYTISEDKFGEYWIFASYDDDHNCNLYCDNQRNIVHGWLNSCTTGETQSKLLAADIPTDLSETIKATFELPVVKNALQNNKYYNYREAR